MINSNFLEPPYLIFQEIINEDITNTSSVHMVKLKPKGTLSIGRALKNDIRINDVSVSRRHCFLRTTRFGLYLQDLDSKFGSLVMLNRPFEVCSSSNGRVFQMGRSFLCADVRAKWKWYRDPEYMRKPRIYRLGNYEEAFNWVCLYYFLNLVTSRLSF